MIIRDPNDTTRCFTKITGESSNEEEEEGNDNVLFLGNARPKRMYFVVFYGSTADFAWVPDTAVLPYHGVEAFTKYAQESVDKALTKSQKEQLMERFQLKVTISRRDDWEMAVREADESLKQTSETRLENIEPKVLFYTKKFRMFPSLTTHSIIVDIHLDTAKGQPGRKSKASLAKAEESSEPVSAAASSADPNEPSALTDKGFDFKSDDDDDDDEEEDESSADETTARKSSSMKIKLKKQTSNDTDTPPAKRRYVRKSNAANESTTVFGQTANGSSVSYQQRASTSETPATNGNSPGKKRGRPRLSKPSVINSNGDNESATTPKKTITKPKAFMDKVNDEIFREISIDLFLFSHIQFHR